MTKPTLIEIQDMRCNFDFFDVECLICKRKRWNRPPHYYYMRCLSLVIILTYLFIYLFMHFLTIYLFILSIIFYSSLFYFIYIILTVVFQRLRSGLHRTYIFIFLLNSTTYIGIYLYIYILIYSLVGYLLVAVR